MPRKFVQIAAQFVKESAAVFLHMAGTFAARYGVASVEGIK